MNSSLATTRMATNTNAMESTHETVYKSVLYQDSVGTLKLNDEHLSFHTSQKVSVLPWTKVVKRQVLSSGGGDNLKHKTKLVLESGNEAVFQVQDRVSLEVLRDDMAERLQTWRKNFKPEEDMAVNKTAAPSSRRMSTPYRYVSASARNLTKDCSKRSVTSEADDIQVSSGPSKQRGMAPGSESINVSAGKPHQRQARRMSTPYRYVSANARDLTKEPSKRSVTSDDNIRVSAGTKKESNKPARHENGRYGLASANRTPSKQSLASEPSSKRENGKKFSKKPARRQSTGAPYQSVSSMEDLGTNKKEKASSNNKRNGTTEKEEEKASSLYRIFSGKSVSSRNLKKTQPRRNRRASLA